MTRPAELRCNGADETEALYRRAVGGDEAALVMLIDSARPLMAHAARPWLSRARSAAEREEILQIATVALIETVRKPQTDAIFVRVLSKAARWALIAHYTRRTYLGHGQYVCETRKEDLFDDGEVPVDAAVSDGQEVIEAMAAAERLAIVEMAAERLPNLRARMAVKAILTPIWDEPLAERRRGRPGNQREAELADALGLSRVSVRTYADEATWRPALQEAMAAPLDPAEVGWRTERRAALAALIARWGEAMPVAHRLILREVVVSSTPVPAAALAAATRLPLAEVEAVVRAGARYNPRATGGIRQRAA
jgi:hypothetical protein